MCEMQRKILALLLSVALILSCFPIVTSASEILHAEAIEKTEVETIGNDGEATDQDC